MESKEKKPVALWKGIVGTALSLHLFGFGLVFSLLYRVTYDNPALLIMGLIILVLSTISLVINSINLINTISYKRKYPTTKNKRNKKDDTELLHKLLKEGKITIEEYDQLNKKEIKY